MIAADGRVPLLGLLERSRAFRKTVDAQLKTKRAKRGRFECSRLAGGRTTHCSRGIRRMYALCLHFRVQTGQEFASTWGKRRTIRASPSMTRRMSLTCRGTYSAEG